MQPNALCNLALDQILLQRRKLRRQFLSCPDLKDIRIAVLGGSTTNELVDLFELLLLESGFRPAFYQSEYGRFYEDAVLDAEKIAAYKPDLIYVHTCTVNVKGFPPICCSEADFSSFVDAEFSRYRAMWDTLGSVVGCQIIQNNIELPMQAILGNLDAVCPAGATRFINELNRRFTMEIAANPRIILQDLASISARVELNHWFDLDRWFSYKIVNTVEASFAIASSLAALVRVIYGRARKLLVLDLDNTVWGGVIGDDGPDKIVLGRETPVAEAYTAFQEYCLSLHERGILLAVCSKNDEEVAKEGFAHPDSVLKLEHFSSSRQTGSRSTKTFSPSRKNSASASTALSFR